MPYIPQKHMKYNLLPFCRKNGGEVFEYPDMEEIEKYLEPGETLIPYGYKSYEEYYTEVDRIMERYALNPEVKSLFENFKSQMIELNQKEEWSIVKYIGPDYDSGSGLTKNRFYYWPTTKNNPVYSGVVDDEEFTSYLYETDAELWEIIEDPTGMAYRTIHNMNFEVL